MRKRRAINIETAWNNTTVYSPVKVVRTGQTETTQYHGPLTEVARVATTSTGGTQRAVEKYIRAGERTEMHSQEADKIVDPRVALFPRNGTRSKAARLLLAKTHDCRGRPTL